MGLLACICVCEFVYVYLCVFQVCVRLFWDRMGKRKSVFVCVCLEGICEQSSVAHLLHKD